MSRFRRKKQGQVDAVAEPASDVRIVPPAEGNDVLAELSEAFGADDDEQADDGEAFDDAETEPTASFGDISDELARAGKRTTIAIGGDDDLPDAVYLDDEFDDDASDTVFIDDDGSSDAIPARDATGRGMEPRLRQRRIGVRRAEGRRRLRIVALVAFVLVVIVGVLATLGSPLFAVDDVDVTGLQFSDGEAVTDVLDDIVGEPVLLVDTGDAERRLEAIPYVEDARVRTSFPGSLRVEIRERVPVATSPGTDGRFRILDAEGRVVDVIDGQPVAFVLVNGTVGLDTAAGGFAPDGFSAAAAMTVKLTPEIRSRLISMSTTPDGSDLRFLLSNGDAGEIEVRLGTAITDSDQIERLVRLQLLLDDVASGDTTVIDVSTAEATER